MVFFPQSAQEAAKFALAACVGFTGLKLAGVAIRFLRYIYAHLLMPRRDLAARYGLIDSTPARSYIVVTGANNEGIAYVFAQEFAAKGFSIALVGHTADTNGETKLLAVAAKLQEWAAGKGHSIQVMPIAIASLGNVGAANDSAIPAIVKALEGVDVAGIVHGAGILTIGKFDGNSMEQNRTILAVNAMAPVLITQALLPKLTARVASGASPRSALILIGSSLGLRASGHGMNLYSATKALVNFFGQSTSMEFEGSLDVLTAHPCIVSTTLLPMPVNGISVITPQQCARACLSKIGTFYVRHSWTNGYFTHELLWWLALSVPRVLYQKVLGKY